MRSGTFDGDALAAVREKRGLSQVALARTIEVHPSAISHYERGRVEPSAKVARALCDALKAEWTDLVTTKQAVA